jgi:hypothetical protein
MKRPELEHLIDDGRKIEPEMCSLCKRLADAARADLAAAGGDAA